MKKLSKTKKIAIGVGVAALGLYVYSKFRGGSTSTAPAISQNQSRYAIPAKTFDDPEQQKAYNVIKRALNQNGTFNNTEGKTINARAWADRTSAARGISIEQLVTEWSRWAGVVQDVAISGLGNYASLLN